MKFKFVLLTIVLFIVILSVAAQVKPPIAILPIPTPAQLQWQKMDAYAFVHFGLNTFNDLEQGENLFIKRNVGGATLLVNHTLNDKWKFSSV